MERSSIGVRTWIRHIKVAVLRLIKGIIDVTHKSSSKFLSSAKRGQENFYVRAGGTLKLPEPAMRSKGLWESLGTSTDGNQDHKASRDDVICTNSLPKDAVILTNACALSWVSRAFGRRPPRWTINLLAKNQNIRKRRLFLYNVKIQLQSLRGYQKMAKGNANGTRFHYFIKCFIWPLSPVPTPLIGTR